MRFSLCPKMLKLKPARERRAFWCWIGSDFLREDVDGRSSVINQDKGKWRFGGEVRLK